HNKQFKWILNAWQFYYALSKVFYGAMQWLGQCVVHHLIGRYVKGDGIDYEGVVDQISLKNNNTIYD
ncbi:hypothetical protein, partial [Vibrio sp. S12_S33]|uniref:hypothetical protein n=1 Tax=Vibrio sp. S12_S33 TaxID=2720223 RepID=UPI0030802548|nr:hypothetical protein [Vibrio sp. S12_S33]